MAHSSIVGGSTAARVMTCPGSRHLAAKLPPQEVSTHMIRGTVLHGIMEMALINDLCPSTIDGVHTGSVFKIAEGSYALCLDDILQLNDAWTAVQKVMDDYNIDVYTEEQVVKFHDVPELEGVFGSADMIGFTPTNAEDKTCVVVDFKFGHHPVKASGNRQLKFYAAAALTDPDNRELIEENSWVRTVIIQPSVYGDDYDVAPVTQHELGAFTANLVLALELDALNESEHCRFCPAVSICPLKKKELDKFKELDVEVAEDLTRILDAAEAIEQTIKKARAAATTALEAGMEIPGYKLVAKRATRQWAGNEDKVLELAGKARKLKREDYTSSKLLSPAQLEKACKAKGVDFKKFEEYCTSLSSGNTLAPEDDPRPAIVTIPDRDIPDAFQKELEKQG